MNKYPIVLSILVIFIISSLFFNFYQHAKNTELTNQIDTLNNNINNLENEKNELNNKLSTLTTEKEQLNAQVSDLNLKITDIESLIKSYLKSQGKITVDSKKCEDEPIFCLNRLAEKSTGVSGIDCSPVKDGSCPLWCAAGADADCCEKKDNYMWIEGRGCYDVSQI